MKRKEARWAALLLCAGLLAAAALWLGSWPMADWRERVEAARLSGGAAETLTLRRRALTVQNGAGETVWRSEKGWLVQDFCVGDVTGDGAPELLVLLYKRGSYGASRPFWEKENDAGWSQHIFIYSWSGEAGAPRPIWMASALPVRAAGFSLDGGTLCLQTARGGETRWRWHSFGLERVDSAATAF